MSDKPDDNYTYPPTRDWAERANDPEYAAGSELVKGVTAPASDDGYIGVDPIYRNASEDFQKPLVGDSGPEAEMERQLLADDVDNTKGLPPETVEDSSEEQDEKEDDNEVRDSQSGLTSAPAGPSQP